MSPPIRKQKTDPMMPFDDEPFMLSAETATSGAVGRDELNFAEFPIALVTDRIPNGQKTIKVEDRIFDKRKGRHVDRRLIITAADEYGLPTAKDDEVILGLIQLTREKNDFGKRTVDFSRSELIELLDWPDTGPSYRRLTTSLQRWLGVTLTYENAWWDKTQDQWTTIGFHVLESFKLVGGGRRGTANRRELPLSSFTWNETIFKSFQAGYIKKLDLKFYLGLAYPTSKRIFRFLDKRFYHRPEWEFDLREFAFGRVGLSRNYEGNIQIARKLEPAIRELEEQGFLEPLPRVERFPRNGRKWRVKFVRKERAGVDAVDLPDGPSPELVAELANRGVTVQTARVLVASFPPDRIRAKIEIYDFELVRGTLTSPAGFLVRAIERDYGAPAKMKDAIEKERRRRSHAESARRQEEARAREEAEAQGREEAERERLEACWRALGLEQQENLFREALAKTDSFNAKQYRRHERSGSPSEKLYRDVILEPYLRKLLDNPPMPEGNAPG